MQWERLSMINPWGHSVQLQLQCRPIKKYIISLYTFWRDENHNICPYEHVHRNCMNFIHRTEFEWVKILFWQLQIFLLIFIRGLRGLWQGPRRPLHKWPLLKSAAGCIIFLWTMSKAANVSVIKHFYAHSAGWANAYRMWSTQGLARPLESIRQTLTKCRLICVSHFL